MHGHDIVVVSHTRARAHVRAKSSFASTHNRPEPPPAAYPTGPPAIQSPWPLQGRISASRPSAPSSADLSAPNSSRTSASHLRREHHPVCGPSGVWTLRCVGRKELKARRLKRLRAHLLTLPRSAEACRPRSAAEAAAVSTTDAKTRTKPAENGGPTVDATCQRWPRLRMAAGGGGGRRRTSDTKHRSRDSSIRRSRAHSSTVRSDSRAASPFGLAVSSASRTSTQFLLMSIPVAAATEACRGQQVGGCVCGWGGGGGSGRPVAHGW